MKLRKFWGEDMMGFSRIFFFLILGVALAGCGSPLAQHKDAPSEGKIGGATAAGPGSGAEKPTSAGSDGSSNGEVVRCPVFFAQTKICVWPRLLAPLNSRDAIQMELRVSGPEAQSAPSDDPNNGAPSDASISGTTATGAVDLLAARGLQLDAEPYMEDMMHGARGRPVVEHPAANVYILKNSVLMMSGTWNLRLYLRPLGGGAVAEQVNLALEVP